MSANSSDLLIDLESRTGRQEPRLALLIDPDKTSKSSLQDRVHRAEDAGFSYIFIGGSLLTTHNLKRVSAAIGQLTNLPRVLFPSHPAQIEQAEVEAILLLSLISGRNADFLIGHHVVAAPALLHSPAEIWPTGYLLFDSGAITTAHYISQTLPLPANKPELAASTALAGQMLGLRLIYADAGSGASQPIAPHILQAISQVTSVPLIVGGGLNSIEKARVAYDSGANVLVFGNHTEENPAFISKLATLRQPA